ncbi:hypothetical protein EJB05_54052 [Eragrostis curvula]|uniref:Uncharacterized protein n=1 Tax=Eragrostis curvula TaxID=38414 RepID=A0A5J9SNF8_9POAL|nr:hypothetical protein EJB05_54052 [Eragrostis curvula]
MITVPFLCCQVCQMKNENVRSSSTGQKFAHTLLQWTGANCLMTGVSFSTNFERRKKGNKSFLDTLRIIQYCITHLRVV